MSKRIKFLFIHFLCSVLIVLIASVIIFGLWYLGPLANALGVSQLFLMLILIDVVIGPLLGWLVYKEGKKTLKFDLSFVIILQVCAFSYGFYTIAQGRPAWIVYDSSSFIVVKNSDINWQDGNFFKKEFSKAPWFGPKFVALDLQNKYEQRNNALLGFDENKTIRNPLNYNNLTNANKKIHNFSVPLLVLDKYNNTNDIQGILKKYPKANAWVALSAPVQDMVVLINKENAEVIKIVDLKPWN